MEKIIIKPIYWFILFLIIISACAIGVFLDGEMQGAMIQAEQQEEQEEEIVKDVRELVEKTTSNKQFIQAAASLDLITGDNFANTDIDNDGENEIIFILPDYLNMDYSTLYIIDQVEGKFILAKYIMEELAYFDSPDSLFKPPRPLKILDITGDEIPEILLFLNSGRWGANLYVFSYYSQQLKELFSVDYPVVYPEFIFTDQNYNGILEIKVLGEYGYVPFGPSCNACQRMQGEEIFEYNPKEKIFKSLSLKYLDIPGTFYYFLGDIKKLGFEHSVFQDWSEQAREKFQPALEDILQGGISVFHLLGDENGRIPRITGQGKTELTLQLFYKRDFPIYEAMFKKINNAWEVVSFEEE